MVATLAPATLLYAAPATAAPVGAGFQLDRGDLEFILKQIQIAERHVTSRTPEGTYPCSAMLGTGEHQIPNDGPNGEVLPWGLRTVSGTCNNLVAGQENYGAADQVFPRKTPKQFRAAETVSIDLDGPGPMQLGQPTTYDSLGGVVFDSQPRVISNLVVDQTKHNPAAVAASGLTPAEVDALPDRQALDIPNVAPDVGLSAPFNSVFTLFGQFFDHGLDLVGKTGGTVLMPLQPDDPLYDQVPPQLRFMVLSRATVDENHEAINLTTPFVDQNQTYTSHPSHQVFLREYAAGATGPEPTGRLIESGDGMATWARVKEQARALLGVQLRDLDVLNVPKLVTDPYGHFVPGANGYPQIELVDGTTLEGDPAANDGQGVLVSNGAAGEGPAAKRTGHAFLDDIAHHAVPIGPAGAPTQLPLAPDADDTITPAEASQPTGTYDDEMLDAHFIAGDGRANENIGLTAIHHIFHSEHNRLAANIDQMLEDIGTGANATAADHAFYEEWHAQAPGNETWAYGERLFQAARFVTEMEYQHLVFEEFARKVQPMVNLFGEGGTGYATHTDPAIAAEFAHAVYRFGHSMLTETVTRRNIKPGTPANNDIGLIDAFLNPPAFMDSGAPDVALTADEAAGSVFRGMSRQVGNEIDEFVTEALRNNLLGLPLDLPTINLARARDTGVPSLNVARRTFYEESGNSALKPYESWTDFGFSLKHRESLVNFVAAYGQHPTITGATTMAAKRAAAEALVNPVPVEAVIPEGADPTDPAVIAAQQEAAAASAAAAAAAAEFMNGTGAWSGVETGINLVDLWVGGLAEKQMVFGGLLGSTFNYVFEKQMEDLQFGDRFYYLSRTVGLNLLVQLEGNSFAELIMRNTDVSGLPADVFSRPDLIFNVPALGTSGPVLDDPATEYDESAHLSRMQDGTIRHGGPEHTVWNGVDASDVAANPGLGLRVDDRMWASEGDDTMRGNSGNDRMEGGDGVDNLIGGEDDDILTDLFGDDVLKGGPGNDALSSGQGFGGDLNQGGYGQDFIVGGNDAVESFAGAGDDFVYAGDGEDTVFGDEGSDWIEGGKGPFNLLQGDSGNPFQDDPNGGHDVIDGDGGEQDYDSEGGDDIMLAGPGIQRSEGMLGFDWVTHKGDPSRANSDMDISVFLPPTINDLRDRFDLVEGLSGWKLDDVLRGDDRVAADLGTADEASTHALTDAGIDRVAGLRDLLPAGATSFNAGNIILGGAGNDTIEGRGGDDVIDGDKWLNVQLRVPDLSPGAPVGATRLVDSMKAIQTDVFAGRINPASIEIVRSIVPTAGTGEVDAAVFSGAREEYTLTAVGDGALRVVHSAPAGAVDTGTDTLRGIEELRFADATVLAESVLPNQPATGSVTLSSLTPVVGATLSALQAVADAEGVTADTIAFSWQVEAGDEWTEVFDEPTFIPGPELVGMRLRVAVSFLDGAGNPEMVISSITGTVSAAAPEDGDGGSTPPGDGDGGSTPPGDGDGGSTPPGDGDGGSTPPGDGGPTPPGDGGSTPPGDGGSTPPGDGGSTPPGDGGSTPPGDGGSTPPGDGGSTPPGGGTTEPTRPSKPAIRKVVAGKPGGRVTARVAWAAPAATGGSDVVRYRVVALKIGKNGAIVARSVKFVKADARSLTMRLDRGRYRFRVSAVNELGRSRPSTSVVVRAR